MSYIYIKTPHAGVGNSTLFTIGTYDSGKWEPESDSTSPAAAAIRVRYLNGGNLSQEEKDFMEKRISL